MYNLELEKIKKHITESGFKEIVIQLPDGLKQKADFIVSEIEKVPEVNVYICFGSCFGGCDIPHGLNSLGIDLIVQWGHSKFNKECW